MTTDHFLGFLHGLAEMIDTAPTPAQWALIKAKLALVDESPPMPVPIYIPEPPPYVYLPRLIGDDGPQVMPWTLQPYTTC